ncbi:unnamed protein product, partial [Closterium sp. Naga37s-1]
MATADSYLTPPSSPPPFPPLTPAPSTSPPPTAPRDIRKFVFALSQCSSPIPSPHTPPFPPSSFDIRALYIPMSDRSTWRQLVRRVAPLIQQAANEEDANGRGASAGGGSREVMVLAESFGACLALRIAAANPGLLHRLVLVRRPSFLPPLSRLGRACLAWHSASQPLTPGFCTDSCSLLSHPLPSLSSPFFLPLLPPSFFGRFPLSPVHPCPLPPSTLQRPSPATTRSISSAALSCPRLPPHPLAPFLPPPPPATTIATCANPVPSRSTQQRPSPATTRSSACVSPRASSHSSPRRSTNSPRTWHCLCWCEAKSYSLQQARPAFYAPLYTLPTPSPPLPALHVPCQDVALPLLVKRSRVQPPATAATTSGVGGGGGGGGGEASLRVLSPIDYVPAACASWRLSLLNDQSGLSDAVLRSIHAPTLLVCFFRECCQQEVTGRLLSLLLMRLNNSLCAYLPPLASPCHQVASSKDRVLPARIATRSLLFPETPQSAASSGRDGPTAV